MVTVTRQDLSPGYQTVQSAHVLAEFAHEHPALFKEWKENSNSLICLAVKDEKELQALSDKLKESGVTHSQFLEPDVEQLTAIAIEPSVLARKLTSYIPLANKKAGEIDKHKLTKEKLFHDMNNTFQFENQSVFAHGGSVYHYYQMVMMSLENGQVPSDLKIPQSFFDYKDFIKENLYDDRVLREYMVLHDCGKPYCRTVDENGKQHFPDHAQRSYEVYTELFGNETVGQLIKDDMDIHLLKDEGIDEFMKKPIQQIITHLVVGLAELLSNSQMFGGIESTGFKIKYKNLEKRSKKILSRLFGDVKIAA